MAKPVLIYCKNLYVMEFQDSSYHIFEYTKLELDGTRKLNYSVYEEKTDVEIVDKTLLEDILSEFRSSLISV